ncbi:MAG: pseudouridine synthase [bacterium]
MIESGDKTMRINRFLARAGIASRRDSEKLIESGRIAVNGETVRELATKIKVNEDIVTLDGNRINLITDLAFKFYKPRNMVCTLNDPQGRQSLGKFLESKEIPFGVVPAGRLDKDSEGLLILTNDGELLNRLIHPRYEVKKIYRVLIDRWPIESDLDTLRKGVKCAGFIAKPIFITRMGPQTRDDENPTVGYWLEFIMGEGKKREIREMMGVVKYGVLRLVRIKHGPISIGTLRPGEIRPLDDFEKSELEKISSQES